MLGLFTDIDSVPCGWTVTLDVMAAKPGAVAVIVAVPGVPPVTLNPMIWVPAGTNNDGGTVATFVFDEVRVKVTAVGAGADIVTLRLPTVGGTTVSVAGVSVAVTPTFTCVVAGFNP